MSAQISTIGEQELVKLILNELAKFQQSDLIVQPGDDAAVLASMEQPTITADILIEDVHFKTSWSSASNIGKKAAAANLADLIAMGARPRALTVSLGMPPTTEVSFVTELVAAIAIEAQQVQAQVVGGDVTMSEKLVISISALGDCEHRAPILRSGAKIGDQVGLIGSVGHAQAGLLLLKSGLAEPAELIAAHQAPSVDYQAGIAAWSSATAMIDISDGLAIDAHRIASASGVRVELEPELLQALITPNLTDAALALNLDPMEFLLSGGEDHGFLITSTQLPEAAIKLGEVKSGSGVWLDQSPIALLGYQHFSE
ncbi:MAG: thiamine-phosphate kinase [Candidatus Nanopelagicales bacterium]